MFLKLKTYFRPKIAILCTGTDILLAGYIIFHFCRPFGSPGGRVEHVSLLRDLPRVNLSLMAAGIVFPLKLGVR
jgi:hypothetical protein